MSGKYAGAERVVVKVGTGTLFGESPRAGNGYRFLGDQLDAFCHEIASMDMEIAVVSSGAIATAAVRKCLPVPKSRYERAQLSGRGQHVLMGRYDDALSKYGRDCAQCLLTHDDIANTGKRRNLRMVMDGYFRDGVIPIINENDTTSTEEITFGDNDILAAALTTCLDADLLVMLSNPVGVLGTGGGESKEAAKRILDKAGTPLEIINGRYVRRNGVWQPKIRALFGN